MAFLLRPSTAVAAGALVLSFAAAAEWWRSRESYDAAWVQTPGGIVATVFSNAQHIVIGAGREDDLGLSMGWRQGMYARAFRPNNYPVQLGDQLEGGTALSHLGLVSSLTEMPTAHEGASWNPFFTSTFSARAIYVPHAVACLGPAWFPAAWGVGQWRDRGSVRRRKAGLCVGCGYDLRETPERCPECGREVRPSTS